MHPMLRLVLAAVVGFVAGSVVNMGLVHLGGSVVPPPAGTDPTTMEGLKAALPLFEPRHFLFPFLAHAIGALLGAFVATALAPGRVAGPAWAVALAFLAGGIAATFMLPAPVWFTVLDLGLAYLPAAWIGHRLATTLWPPGSARTASSTG